MHLVFEHVHFGYRSLVWGNRHVLSDITFSITSGERVAIVGASGTGKTTLIQLFNGLLKPSSGQIWMSGKNLADPHVDLFSIRKTIGLVFQFPESQLFEETVYRDIGFAPRALGFSEKETDQAIRMALEQVGLDFDQYHARSPFQLSGGEKRRVAIAGVLAMDPEVLVLDEPTVGLDWESRCRIENIMLELHRRGKTIVFVSHDMDFVARVAKRILVLCQGRIYFDGTPADFFASPQKVKEAGLRLPSVTQCLQSLRKAGMPIRTEIYTLEEAKKELKPFQGRKVFENALF